MQEDCVNLLFHLSILSNELVEEIRNWVITKLVPSAKVWHGRDLYSA